MAKKKDVPLTPLSVDFINTKSGRAGSQESIKIVQPEPLSQYIPPKLPATITDTQLEAWKKMPKEEALKEAIGLFRANSMDVPEARLKLEVLKFICELQGVMQPQQSSNKNQVVFIQVNAPAPTAMKVIQEGNARRIS